MSKAFLNWLEKWNLSIFWYFKKKHNDMWITFVLWYCSIMFFLIWHDTNWKEYLYFPYLKYISWIIIKRDANKALRMAKTGSVIKSHCSLHLKPFMGFYGISVLRCTSFIWVFFFLFICLKKISAGNYNELIRGKDFTQFWV